MDFEASPTRGHYFWLVENVKDRSLLSAGVNAIRSPYRSRLDSLAGAERTACGGFGAPRPRAPARTLDALYANCDPSRLTTAKQPSRIRLTRIRHRSPALCASLKPTRHGPPRWPWSCCQNPKSLTRSLAEWLSAPSVRLTPEGVDSPRLVAKRSSHPPAVESRRGVAVERSREHVFQRPAPTAHRRAPGRQGRPGRFHGCLGLGPALVLRALWDDHLQLDRILRRLGRGPRDPGGANSPSAPSRWSPIACWIRPPSTAWHPGWTPPTSATTAGGVGCRSGATTPRAKPARRRA